MGVTNFIFLSCFIADMGSIILKSDVDDEENEVQGDQVDFPDDIDYELQFIKHDDHNSDSEKELKEAMEEDEILVKCKIQIVSAQDGNCTAEMTVSEEHTNTNGTLHGGMTSTIVDVVSGIALVTHKNPSVGVSVDLHIRFLNAAPIGEQIVIEARTNKSGKNLAFLAVEIRKKSNGQLLAEGSHTKFALSR